MLLMFWLFSQISICFHAFSVDFGRKLKTGEEEINGLEKQLRKHFVYFRAHQERKALRRVG